RNVAAIGNGQDASRCVGIGGCTLGSGRVRPHGSATVKRTTGRDQRNVKEARQGEVCDAAGKSQITATDRESAGRRKRKSADSRCTKRCDLSRPGDKTVRVIRASINRDR